MGTKPMALRMGSSPRVHLGDCTPPLLQPLSRFSLQREEAEVAKKIRVQ